MDNKIEKLKESLPRECCSICAHLSLEGPNDDYKYNIKCIISNDAPNSDSYCEYFKPEHSDITSTDIDSLYNNFLQACVQANYKEYLNSAHFKIFKNHVLTENLNSCSICGHDNDLEVYHINKNLGRETLNDVTVVCNKCINKPSY